MPSVYHTLVMVLSEHHVLGSVRVRDVYLKASNIRISILKVVEYAYVLYSSSILVLHVADIAIPMYASPSFSVLFIKCNNHV